MIPKKKKLLNGGRFFILLNHLIPFKLTSTVPDIFFLVNINSIPVILRVEIGFIGKKLICSFGVDQLGQSLGLGLGWKRSFNLTEAIVKAISEGATKLLQEGIGVTILPYCILLSLSELTLCLQDLFLLILEYFLQHLNLRLRLLQKLPCQVKLVKLDILLGHQLPQLYLPTSAFSLK